MNKADEVKLPEVRYLGDAVYASFDGYQIWLTTGDGNNNRVALEPPVLDNLTKYADYVKEFYRD